MCFAIPLEVMEIREGMALCAEGPVRRWVDLFLLAEQDIRPGDKILVHVGYAIEKLDPQVARAMLDAWGEGWLSESS